VATENIKPKPKGRENIGIMEKILFIMGVSLIESYVYLLFVVSELFCRMVSGCFCNTDVCYSGVEY